MDRSCVKQPAIAGVLRMVEGEEEGSRMRAGAGGESNFGGLEKKLSTSVDVSFVNVVHYISRLLGKPIG